MKVIGATLLLLILACSCTFAEAERLEVIGEKIKVSFEAGDNISNVVPSHYDYKGGLMDKINFESSQNGIIGIVEVEYNPSPTRANVNLTEECIFQIARSLKVPVEQVLFQVRNVNGQNITAGEAYFMAVPVYATEFRPIGYNDTVITVIVDLKHFWNVVETMNFAYV